MEHSRYHYLNALEENMNPNDNINVLQQHFKITPKVVYNIGYTNNNMFNGSHVYFFDGKTPLDVIAKQQTLEPPELVNIFNINLIMNFLTLSESVLKQCKYIMLKNMDVSLRGYLNELGFMEFHRENDDYYFVNIYRTNIIFNSLN
jgi:hypothetical protein